MVQKPLDKSVARNHGHSPGASPLKPPTMYSAVINVRKTEMSPKGSDIVELRNAHLCENIDVLDCLSHFSLLYLSHVA